MEPLLLNQAPLPGLSEQEVGGRAEYHGGERQPLRNSSISARKEIYNKAVLLAEQGSSIEEPHYWEMQNKVNAAISAQSRQIESTSISKTKCVRF